MIPKSITPLADRFDGLRESLDTVVREAIPALGGPAERDSGQSTNEKVKSVVGKLDQSAFKLYMWASDLVQQDLASALGALATRDMNAGDVLYVVETCQMSVGENLHEIFIRLETNLAILLESSKSTTRNSGEEWYALRNLLLSSGALTSEAYILQGLHTMRLRIGQRKPLHSLSLIWMNKGLGFGSSSLP